MKLDYALLATIHRILRQKSDLIDRMKHGPRQVGLAENAEKQIGIDLQEAKEAKKRTQMAADEKQLQLGEREAKIVTLQGRLNAAESNREFQLLKDQIAADEQANSVLSDEILELLERLDEQTAAVERTQRHLEMSKQETINVRARAAEEQTTLQQQLDSVLADLAIHEKRLPGDVAAEYRRLAAGRGEDALAKTDLQTCGHCCTRISTQTISELMLKQAVFCKSCGVLMYATEDHPLAH